MIRKVDKINKYVSMFNPNTGFYMRSGVIENGVDTGVDPFMASFPELLDIGIMGHCIHGASGLCVKSGVQCYQNGLEIKNPNMSFENFKRIFVFFSSYISSERIGAPSSGKCLMVLCHKISKNTTLATMDISSAMGNDHQIAINPSAVCASRYATGSSTSS